MSDTNEIFPEKPGVTVRVVPKKFPDDKRPILCLDFDGVIHSYKSGWQGADKILDPPVLGAFEFIRRALGYFRISVHSSRLSHPGGYEAVRDWFYHYDPSLTDLIEFTSAKPAAFVTLDDRALTFEGVFPDPESLLSFQPWHKRVASDPLPIGTALVRRWAKILGPKANWSVEEGELLARMITDAVDGPDPRFLRKRS